MTFGADADMHEMDDVDSEEELLESQPPPRKKMGRPKGSKNKGTRVGMNGRTVTITKQTYVGNGEEDEDLKDDSFAPLFDTAAINERSIVRCRVIRREPDEGMVGYIDDPQTGDNTIQEQWGGSVYRLEGLNSEGRIVAVRTVKLAGDPIFKSQAAEFMWRKSKGLPPAGAGSTGAAAPGMTFNELMAIQNASEEKRRAEEREHQKAMRQMELDAEDKRRKDEDERLRARRLDEEERDKRRQKDEEEREARRRREQQEAEQRQHAHMQQTIQMIQASSQQALQFANAKADERPANPTAQLLETVKAIAVIKEAFGAGGPVSDEPEDTLQTLFKNLPAILNGAGGAIGSAIREVKGGGVAGMGMPGLAPMQASPVAALLPAGSPLASKLETLVTKIAAQGRDPEQVLDKVADGLLSALDGKAAPAPEASVSVTPDAVIPATPFKADNPPVRKSTAIRIPMGKRK